MIKKEKERESVIANAEKAKREDELVIANKEKAKRAAELVIANQEKAKREDELVIAKADKAEREDELIIANEEKAERKAELVIAEEEKEKRAAELVIANEEKEKREAELVIANEEKEKRAAELVIAIEEKEKRAAELVIAKADKAKLAVGLVIANAEKAKRSLELVIANEEKEKRADELIIADKVLVYQNEEKEKREAELVIADIIKSKREAELVIAKIEKAKRIAKSIITDKELSVQTEEISKRAAESVIADAEKAKRSAELVIANIKKAKRSAELIIANIEKAKRSAELVIANKELVYQKNEKAKHSAELIIANIEKAKRSAKLAIANLEKSKVAAEFVLIKKDLTLAREKEKLTAELIIVNKKLRETNVELISAKEKAEECDRLKSAFLTNISHEIRTPMNGILGFAELLKRPNLSVETQQQYLEIIEQSSNRMLDTINNIVDISTIEAGLMNFNISESNINKQIEFIYEFFIPMAKSKGLQLSFNCGLPSTEAIINTDSGKINSILTNLVKNAIKFTDEGLIEFGYEKKGEYLEFFVEDTGIGIRKDRVDIIFERFIKADIEDKRAFQGSGLGLTISKSYVEKLGGKFWVESEEGKGSSFYFTIPYNAVSEEKIKSKNSNVTPEELSEIKKKNLKILIVEDDEISSSLLTKILQNISKTVLHAITGVEAIEVCRNNPDIDLVLMDIRMPKMNGLEATRHIRKFNKDVNIIAQTAYAFTGDSKKAIEAGCNDCISKPIDKDLLITKILQYTDN